MIGGWWYVSGYKSWEKHTIKDLLKRRLALVNAGPYWDNHVKEIDEELHIRKPLHIIASVTLQTEVKT